MARDSTAAATLLPGSIDDPTMPADLVVGGWQLARGRNNVGWRSLHPAAHPQGQGALTFGTPEEAIAAAREIERAAADARTSGVNGPVDRLRAARQYGQGGSPMTAAPSTPATPVPYWGRGRGKAGKTAHLWAEVEPYTWQSACGTYRVAERQPPADSAGTHCPTCAEREREQAAAPPPETPTLAPQHRFTRPANLPERGPIPLAAIVPGRWQPRTVFDEAELTGLAASIREHGVLTAIKVFVNERQEFELIAGERRVRASRQIGLTEIPAEVVEWTAGQIQEVALIDNLQRKELSEVEEGVAFERLITELGLSENKLAQRLGINRAYIQQRRALAKAAPAVHTALAAKEITLSHARAIALAAAGDHASQAKAVEKVKKQSQYGGVNENAARTYTEQIVFEANLKALKKLGWKVIQPPEYSMERPTIYSKADRPRRWSSTEVLEAVREQRKPSTDGVVAAGELTADQKAILTARLGSTGIVTAKYDPWIAIAKTHNSWDYVTPAEAAALAAEYQQEQDAAAARYRACGWTLTLRGGGWYADTDGKASEYLWDWSQVLKLVERIEKGYTGKEPGSAAASSLGSRCACGAPHVYWDGATRQGRCADCQRTFEAECVKQQAAIRAHLATQAGWLTAVPADVARLLVISTMRVSERLGFDHGSPDAKVAAALSATDEQVRETLLDLLQTCVWGWRETELGQRYLPPAEATPDQAQEVGQDAVPA